MGLDMYLKAERYVSGYSHSDDLSQNTYEWLVKNMGVQKYVDKGTPSARINFTVGYWRKENHIHKWFVNNCQDGNDDCGSYEVGRDQLRELRDLCQKVLDGVEMEEGELVSSISFENGKQVEHKIPGKVVADASVAKELLPTESGFFFGGTEYDEWYVRGCQQTIEIINRVLEMPDNWYFEYQSSW